MSFPLRSRATGGGSKKDALASQVNNRRANDRAIIENPLAYFTDAELQRDVRHFCDMYLPSVPPEKLLRAARVAKDIRTYDAIARKSDPAMESKLPVILSPDEKHYLKRERDKVFSEKGMRIVIVTVSIAALLQGFVQSSFNSATLYKGYFGLGEDTETNEWRLGAVNASPWFAATLVGCPLSLPINYWFGRRGGMMVASAFIFASSVGSIFAHNWVDLTCVRIVNGLGMGIKAVSTPILASETAVGFWRGSAILAWQMWVAFGIMLGFAVNLLFTVADSDATTLGLIQGAPLVPSLALFIIVLFFCPESPRYHLMKGPNYSPEKAYHILRRLRNTELQALRDMYAVHKSIEQEYMGAMTDDPQNNVSPGFWYSIADFLRQNKQLFQQRRLYNALISAGVVNLAQQLCGINVLAFYSGELFSGAGARGLRENMAYSLGFGAINFLFVLPALKSIDTLGRRRWLLMTLPLMALFMLGAALSFNIANQEAKTGVVALFLFLFAAAYSPALGPIPFTLASESFPLSHRESGTAWPVATNFFFAGILSIFYPSIARALGDGGSLGLFSGLNVLAFILVLFLVEETKNLSLEDLDLVFAVSKRRFISFQAKEYIPWFVKRYIFGQVRPEPRLYQDLIWGSGRKGSTSTGNTLPKRYTMSTMGQSMTGSHHHNGGPIGSPITDGGSPEPMEPIYEPYEPAEMPGTPVSRAKYMA